MGLRYKLGLLAALYVASLTANVALCSWCILMYHHSFLEGVSADEVVPASSLPLAGTNEQSGPEGYVLRILVMNALAGLGVAFLGFRFVHRWVTEPIEVLRRATVRIGGGDLSHRVKVASRDEFGQMAREVNEMMRSIVAMQGQIVEQERRQVAAQALRCVVHNIRSPLTGIRWLAEAVTMREDVAPRVRRDQQQITEKVDGVLAWLAEFRESLAQVSMQTTAVELESMITPALEAARVRAAERSVSLTARVDHDLGPVHLDRKQVTAALEAMLFRAIESAERGQSIEVTATRCSDRAGYWQLAVYGRYFNLVPQSADSGLPTGEIGMIDRVARLHGGILEEHRDCSGKVVLKMTMPG